MLCTPRSERRAAGHAGNMRKYRNSMPQWRKSWEHAVKVESRHTYPNWPTMLKVPRGAEHAQVGDWCVFVECTAKVEPDMWPKGKVVGVVGARLIVERKNFAGVSTHAQKYAAVCVKKAWKVSRWYR